MPQKKIPIPAHELSPVALELIAARFRALSEPMRLRLLKIAMHKEGLTTICHIADPIVRELCDMMCSRLREEMESKAAALSFDPKI